MSGFSVNRLLTEELKPFYRPDGNLIPYSTKVAIPLPVMCRIIWNGSITEYLYEPLAVHATALKSHLQITRSIDIQSVLHVNFETAHCFPHRIEGFALFTGRPYPAIKFLFLLSCPTAILHSGKRLLRFLAAFIISPTMNFIATCSTASGM